MYHNAKYNHLLGCEVHFTCQVRNLEVGYINKVEVDTSGFLWFEVVNGFLREEWLADYAAFIDESNNYLSYREYINKYYRSEFVDISCKNHSNLNPLNGFTEGIEIQRGVF